MRLGYHKTLEGRFIIVYDTWLCIWPLHRYLRKLPILRQYYQRKVERLAYEVLGAKVVSEEESLAKEPK